ncbi:MAG: hypothetical protein PHC75_02025 [Burkholderiales bacterium]|nr:hypothetical protein [Burkholderiales bacterium]
MKKNIRIKLNWQAIVFFVLLETITVPMVAMANNFARINFLYLAIMGFLVALIALIFLIKILERYFIRNSEKIFSFKINAVHNLWLIPLFAGILEMVMFLVQGELFNHGYRDYSAGFWSAFISVFVSLIIYKFLLDICVYSLKFIDENNEIFVLKFNWWNLFLISFLFGIYEMVVCPITGWWIPYQGFMRFFIAVVSGIVGGFAGSFLIVLITHYFKQLEIKLQLCSY